MMSATPRRACRLVRLLAVGVGGAQAVRRISAGTAWQPASSIEPAACWWRCAGEEQCAAACFFFPASFEIPLKKQLAASVSSHRPEAKPSRLLVAGEFVLTPCAIELMSRARRCWRIATSPSTAPDQITYARVQTTPVWRGAVLIRVARHESAWEIR